MKNKHLLLMLLMALLMPWAANAQTSLWSEDFEDGSMPTGWTTDGSGSWSVATAVNSTHPSSAGEGTYCAQISHGSTGNATKLITPEIDLSSVTSAELSFMHAQQSWSGDIDGLKVYYRTSTSGAWTQLVEYTDAYASWTTEDGIILPNLSSTYQIAFEYIDNYGYGLGIDDINIVRGASCPKPTGVAVNNPTTHGATVSWSGSSDSYIVMVAESVVNASYDFETGSMPSAFTNSSTNAWSVVANTHSGAYCAKSAGGFTSTNSDLELTVNLAAAGFVDFSALVSSESGWDFGRFLIDGDQKFEVSGTSNSWTDYSYPLTAGSHTLTWRYYKDGSGNNGDDCFYVDDIVIKEEPSSWYHYPAASSPYTLNDATNIHSATDYMVQVVGVCSGEQSNPSATVSFTTTETCPKPTNLQVTTDGATATVTWDGGATCNVNFDGTIYPSQTSGCSFPVQLSTTYTVAAEAVCTGETSGYCTPVSFTTPDCIGGHTIEYTLNDSYSGADGWTGNPISAILVYEGCGNLVETLTIENGLTTKSGTLTLCGDYYEFIWQAGQYPGECSFTFTEGGTTLFTKPSNLSNGMTLYTIGTPALPKPTALTAGDPRYDNVDLSWTENGSATAWEICINGDESNLVPANTNVNFNLTGLQADNSYSVKVRSVSGNEESCWSDEVTVTTPEACAKPTGLTESNITFTTADLSWTGTANSYVVEYGTWTQAGTDHTATATMTPYTFSLSGFSGKGTIAIRHYNVNDQFYLNVDDIVVRDANENIVYSENFESGSIPAIMSNIDLDGDGYVWGLANSSNMNVNGSYGVYSASWYQGTVLYPDNWLVISDITLGGSITFNACGQDASAAAENFAVYVIADNQFTQAYNGNGTSCQVTGLTEGTAYAWRVQGDCGGQYQSNWVFSMFKTADDLLIFATNGNWNDLNNWTDIDGNPATALPTVDNKVRIDADATIIAGVVATAKNATLNGGSIEIEDGGQLKQGGSVKVTMHKGITAHTEENVSDGGGGWYFIATPHSCSYLEESDLFPYVLNVTDGNYDLYAFDATADKEWINYKSNSSHTEFHTGSNTGLFNKKGYLYANGENKDLQFVGTVSSSLNNILTESYTYNASSTDEFNGWRLVGNPFTCDAYISYVDNDDNVLAADFYTMNTAGNGYDLSASSVALPALTGAFVNYSATGKVQFASEAPSGKGGLLNMTVSQNRGTKVDQARIRFGEGFNLKHMSFREGSTKVYIPQDNNDYAVVSAESQDETPVSFKAEENGTYTLSFNAEEVSFSYLHLIDNMTGADIDLLSSPSYSFEALTTDYENRFKLVFATGSNSDDDSFAFFSDGQLIVSNDGKATLQVIDVNGRILSSETISGSCSKTIEATAGVYMLRLINGENVKVQKIVVR